jgi:hypothetical protein
VVPVIPARRSVPATSSTSNSGALISASGD